MYSSKTANTIRFVLSGRIRELVGRSLDGPVNSDMLNSLEEVTAAYADFTRNHISPDDAETGLAALQEIQHGYKHLAEINKVFETGAGKNSQAHRLIQSLMTLANHNLEEITDTAPTQ